MAAWPSCYLVNSLGATLTLPHTCLWSEFHPKCGVAKEQSGKRQNVRDLHPLSSYCVRRGTEPCPNRSMVSMMVQSCRFHLQCTVRVAVIAHQSWALVRPQLLFGQVGAEAKVMILVLALQMSLKTR